MSRALALSGLIFLTATLCPRAQNDFKWGHVTIGGGGFVSAIITSKTEKNLIYARTDVGGAYRWNEADKAWVSLMDWIGPDYMGLLGVDAIALDPANPKRLYMVAGTDYWNQGKTMVLRSDDYGATFDTIDVTAQFKVHGNEYGRQNGERLAVDPNNPDVLFCGTRKYGLWKSTNRGTSWSQVTGLTAPTNGLGIAFVLFDGNKVAGGTTQRIYAGLSVTGDNLFVSDDAGATWKAIALPVLSKPVMPQRAVLTPKGKFLYVTTANGAGPGFGNNTTISRGAFLRYDTDSKTWENLSPENSIDDPPDPEHPGQTIWDAHLGGYGGVSLDAADSNHIVLASINTWKVQIWDGTQKPAWGDKIFVSSDAGKTWKAVFGDVPDSVANQVPANAAMGVLGNGGYGWIVGQSIHWAGSIEFDPFNPKRVFVTSGNGIYMTENLSPGSRHLWNFAVRGLEETVPENVVSIPGGPLISVIGDYDGFVHRDITQPPPMNHNPNIGSTTGLDFAKKNVGVVVRVGGDDKTADNSDYRFPLYYSLDTGHTWTKFATHPSPGQYYKGKLAVSSDGKVVLWNPAGKNILLRTADWGATWTTVTSMSGMDMRPVADPEKADVFYAFGGEVYRSTDKGLTFNKVSSRNFSSTTDLQVTPGREGHLWITGFAWDGLNGGYLARSTDGGATFKNIDPAEDPVYTQKIQHCEALGFGKAAPGAAYPAIYMYGTIGGVKAAYQSLDEAKTWTRIDDDKHRFGALANGNFIRGDANTFGVVYRSSAGQGIIARMPADWQISTPVRHKARTGVVFSTRFHWIGNSLRIEGGEHSRLKVDGYGLNGSLIFRSEARGNTVLSLARIFPQAGTYILRILDDRSEILWSRKVTVLP